MTGIEDIQKKEYKIVWFVENYSFSPHKIGESLDSSYITVDSLEGTAWFLRLYPRGINEDAKGYISLYLQRSSADDGPRNFPLQFELSILAADNSTLISRRIEFTFKRGDSRGFLKFFRLDKVCKPSKADFLKQDMLAVLCKIWRDKGSLQQSTQIIARTDIRIDRINFLHETPGFSSLEPNRKQIVRINYPTKDKYVLTSSLFYSENEDGGEKIMMEITPYNTKQILLKCELYLIDSSGTLVKCGEGNNQFEAETKDIQKMPMSFTRQVILARKDEYLPDDKLSLICKCIFSLGSEHSTIESIGNEIPIAAFKEIEIDQSEDIFNAAGKLLVCSNALDDFKSTYNSELLTDVEIKTKSKSFAAHKIVLCARSPVFKAMMTYDTKEKNTQCIEIDDVANNILQRFLSFLYSDDLEDLDWESAIALYYAADKYGVEKLKGMCSAFLVENLSTSTAGELLLLADTHSDSHLKNIVEDFIFQHEEQVFTSDEWEHLIKTNAELVSRTMLLKYKRKMSVCSNKFSV